MKMYDYYQQSDIDTIRYFLKNFASVIPEKLVKDFIYELEDIAESEED